MAVVPGTSPPPTVVPLHARTSIPRVVPFRQARCPIPSCRIDLPGTNPSTPRHNPCQTLGHSEYRCHLPCQTTNSAQHQQVVSRQLLQKPATLEPQTLREADEQQHRNRKPVPVFKFPHRDLLFFFLHLKGLYNTKMLFLWMMITCFDFLPRTRQA